MKSENIYTGTIKKCNDLYSYELFGETRYVDTFGNKKSTRKQTYVDIVSESATILKINNEKYIWLNSLNTLDAFLVDLGIPVKAISLKPNERNDYFIDERTLKPYQIGQNNKVKVKTLIKK